MIRPEFPDFIKGHKGKIVFFLGLAVIATVWIACGNVEKGCTHLRVRKDPEWFQTMSNSATSDPNIRVSIIAVTREEDPSEYTHLITLVFHSPGFSNYDPELKKLPNLTSASFLMKLDKNCDLISTEEITTELDHLKATLNMRSVRFPHWVW